MSRRASGRAMSRSIPAGGSRFWSTRWAAASRLSRGTPSADPCASFRRSPRSRRSSAASATAPRYCAIRPGGFSMPPTGATTASPCSPSTPARGASRPSAPSRRSAPPRADSASIRPATGSSPPTRTRTRWRCSPSIRRPGCCTRAALSTRPPARLRQVLLQGCDFGVKVTVAQYHGEGDAIAMASSCQIG